MCLKSKCSNTFVNNFIIYVNNVYVYINNVCHYMYDNVTFVMKGINSRTNKNDYVER